MRNWPPALRVGFGASLAAIGIACVLTVDLAIAANATVKPPNTAQARTVNCYNQAANILSTVGQAACKYQIISADQANAIQEERRSYIRRSMRNAHPSPSKSNVSSFGSGFFVHPAGYAVTNNQVTDRYRQISLLTSDGSSVPATLVASSSREDLTLLKTSTSRKAFATIKKSPARQRHNAGGDRLSSAQIAQA